MTRSLLIAAAFLLSAASLPGTDPDTATAPVDVTVVTRDCPPTAATLAAERAEGATLHRLDEAPSADMYSAVYRRDADGCESPIIIKSGVGRR